MPFSTRFAISFIAISAIIITILMCLGISFKSETNTAQDTFLLKTYKNSVALYCNGEPIKIYKDIVVNPLPQVDVLKFNQGIIIEDMQKIDEILQDYDG